MRRLSGAIPRAFKDSRSREARTYRAFCLALVRRLGPLPTDALPWLREAGLIALELERLGPDLEVARARKRRRDAARIRRQQATLRMQLGRIEDRLAQRVSQDHQPESAAAWAARQQGV